LIFSHLRWINNNGYSINIVDKIVTVEVWNVGRMGSLLYAFPEKIGTGIIPLIQCSIFILIIRLIN